MSKIKGRKIIGLSETAHTWQCFEGKPGWKVEISFNAKTGVVWATPLTRNSCLLRSDNGEVFIIRTYSNYFGYKEKVDYLKRAIVEAIELYESNLLNGNAERKVSDCD